MRDKDRADIYTQMLEKCENDIETLSKRIAELENIDTTIKSEKQKYQTVLIYLIKLLMRVQYPIQI